MNRTVIAWIILAACGLAGPATAADAESNRVNAFYEALVNEVGGKGTATIGVTRLIEKEPETAKKFLGLLKKRIESDPEQKAAFTKLYETLQDGFLLTETTCNKEVSDKIFSQAAHQPELTTDERIFRLRRLVKACPKRAEAYRLLGDLYLMQRQFGMAIKAFEKKQSIESDEATAERMDVAKKHLSEYKKRTTVAVEDVRSLLEKPKTFMAIKPGKLESGVMMRSALQVRVHFDTLSSEIKPEFRTELDTVGRELERVFKEDPKVALLVEGHTDTRGGEEMNLKLSEARAVSIKEYLVKTHNLDSTRVKTVGYGYYRPLAAGTDEESHSLNRRVEFKKE